MLLPAFFDSFDPSIEGNLPGNHNLFSMTALDPNINIQQDSPAWVAYVKVAFLLALGAMAAGIVFMPGELWVKGYFAMGMLFLVASTVALSKTLRDEHEAKRLITKINEVKTQKILKEFDAAA